MNKIRSLEDILKHIQTADADTMNQVRKIWDNKCMPLGSLGWLQETLIQIAGVQQTVRPDIGKKLTIVMAADNGVVSEGVSQSDYHVTTQVVKNMQRDKASIAVLSKQAGSDLIVVDMGMREPVEGVRRLSPIRGTDNMTKGPAMTKETAVSAIEAGANLAIEKAAQGYRLFATGEMGIGNTTSSSAVLAVLSGEPVKKLTGRGAGLSAEGLERKIAAIQKAIRVNKPDPSDPLDVLAKVGGLDIAGLTGVFLGAAVCGVPVVIDGFIASVAALLASRLSSAPLDGMIASHCSKEPGAALVLNMLERKPLIYGDLHLGEGSGAVLLFPMLDAAVSLYEQLPSFKEGNVETYVHLI